MVDGVHSLLSSMCGRSKLFSIKARCILDVPIPMIHSMAKSGNFFLNANTFTLDVNFKSFNKCFPHSNFRYFNWRLSADEVIKDTMNQLPPAIPLPRSKPSHSHSTDSYALSGDP